MGFRQIHLLNLALGASFKACLVLFLIPIGLPIIVDK